MTWIESHVLLRTNTKLINLCNELKITRAQAIGHLHMLWWWAIENREDGNLSGLFDRDIAGACDWDGDAKQLIDALHKCGWLVEYHINDWEQYVGKILGGRERARKYRDRHVSVTLPVTSPSASTIYNKQDNKDMLTKFALFYDKYPKKLGKDKALKAFLKISPNDELLETILRAVEIQSQSPAWKKNNGEFIPYPATWLNGKRWEDEVGTVNRPRKQVL